MKLLRAGAIYTLGDFTSKLLPFFLLPYLSRKLGPAGYGDLVYFMVFVTLASIFIGFSQDSAVPRYYYRYGKKSLGLLIYSGLFISITTYLVLVAICIFISSLEVFYIATAGISQSLLNVQLAIRQTQKKPIEYVAIQVLSTVLTLSLTVFFFETSSEGNDYLLYVKALIIAQFISLIFSLIRSQPTTYISTLRKHKLTARYLILFCTPIVIHQLGLLMKSQFERIAIFSSYDSQTLGFYAAAYQLASIYPILLLACNKAAVPFFYEKLNRKELNILHVMRWTKICLIIFWIPAIAAYFIPNFFFTLFLGAPYSEVKIYVSFFLLGMGLNLPYLILVNFLFFHADTKSITTASVSSAVFHVFLITLSLKTLSIKYLPLTHFISNLLLIGMLYKKGLYYQKKSNS